MRSFHRFSRLTFAAIAGLSSLLGQTAPARSAVTPPPQGSPAATLTDPLRSIKIVVLRGQDGVNRLNQDLIATPAVEVRNANDELIEAATVTFRLPVSGPGASFPGGLFEKKFVTDSSGQVIADGYQPNASEGDFRVQVSAQFQKLTARAELRQRNTRKSVFDEAQVRAAQRRKKWLWFGIAAAGGVAGGVWAIKRGGPAAPPVTVFPGPVVIGGR